MSNEKNNEPNQEPFETERQQRMKRPAVRITAIFPPEHGDNFPPKQLMEMLITSFTQALASFGFTQSSIEMGLLESFFEHPTEVIEKMADKEKFEETAIQKNLDGDEVKPPEISAPDINKIKNQEISNSKITVEEMLKGIDLNGEGKEKENGKK